MARWFSKTEMSGSLATARRYVRSSSARSHPAHEGPVA